MNRQHSRGQVWIETVLYTLIGIALIGLVLSFVYPKIRATQERLLIDQTIESLHALDEVVVRVLERGSGNVKSYKFAMRKGKLIIDGMNDKVTVNITDLSIEYSEPKVLIEDGRILLLTTKGQQTYAITLTLDYAKSNINITANGKDVSQTFTQAATPYTFFVENQETTGPGGTQRTFIDIVEAADRSATR